MGGLSVLVTREVFKAVREQLGAGRLDVVDRPKAAGALKVPEPALSCRTAALRGHRRI